MSTIVPVSSPARPTRLNSSVAPALTLVDVRDRLRDYLSLAKPRISVMVLVTVSVGFTLASRGPIDGFVLFHALVGIGLVAAGSSALNQCLERHTDARMDRTADRPIPSGRIRAAEAALLGVLWGVLGTVWLMVFVNGLTAALTLLTLASYVGLYTPMKRKTSFCTTIGAIPGALPPVLGWTAAGGALDAGALTLFSILFLWQFPHFLAIAWMYQDQYSMAGLRMLPRVNAGSVVGRMAVSYAVVLIPVSLLPRTVGLAGTGYCATAIVLGLGYLLASVLFAADQTRASARRLMFVSLIYLPILLGVLTVDYCRLVY